MTMNPPPMGIVPAPVQTSPPRAVPKPAYPNGEADRLRKFTVAEYHELARLGILSEDENIELLEGNLVLKMAKNPPHESTVGRLNRLLIRLLPNGWLLRNQSSATINTSEPEPDFAIV